MLGLCRWKYPGSRVLRSLTASQNAFSTSTRTGKRAEWVKNGVKISTGNAIATTGYGQQWTHAGETRTGLLAAAVAAMGGALLWNTQCQESNKAERDHSSSPSTSNEGHGEKSSRVTFRSPTTAFRSPYRDDIEQMMFDLQDSICNKLMEIDGGTFQEDQWQRPNDGGGGRSRVLQHGNVIEKGGVNVSVIHGRLPASAVTQMKSRGKDIFGENLPFYVTGVSLVLHPRNPHAPTVHANFRFFEVLSQDPETGEEKLVWWFGGGTDLTPHYLYEEDAKHFHHVLKDSCDTFGEKGMYQSYKKWCDDYFWIPHRNEARGVGGIFFDDLEDLPSFTIPKDESKTQARDRQARCLNFVQGVANSFLDAYIPILLRRKDTSYSFDHLRWQKLRHGRYVEFNLVHDRGTKFGLATPGSRIESILMSLPLNASWEYCHEPEPGSEEAKLLQVLKHPRDWVEDKM